MILMADARLFPRQSVIGLESTVSIFRYQDSRLTALRYQDSRLIALYDIKIRGKQLSAIKIRDQLEFQLETFSSIQLGSSHLTVSYLHILSHIFRFTMNSSI